MNSKPLILFAIFLVLASCNYDQVLEEKIIVTEPVLFSLDITPIFSNSCNTSGCHNGNVAPDLRPSNAYDELISGGYIDTRNPENSELYLWMKGSQGRLQMPPSGTNAIDNAKILAWIKQGALEN